MSSENPLQTGERQLQKLQHTAHQPVSSLLFPVVTSVSSEGEEHTSPLIFSLFKDVCGAELEFRFCAGEVSTQP